MYAYIIKTHVAKNNTNLNRLECNPLDVCVGVISGCFADKGLVRNLY